MSDFEVHPVGTEETLRRSNGTAPAAGSYQAEGTLGEWAADFSGWNYRVQLQRSGLPWTIDGGCILCLVWPQERPGQPVPARLVYVPPAWMEGA